MLLKSVFLLLRILEIPFWNILKINIVRLSRSVFLSIFNNMNSNFVTIRSYSETK